MALSKASTKNKWMRWPEKISLTLKQRTSPAPGDTTETFATSVTQPTCRKRELNKDEITLSESFFTQRSIVFEVWDRDQSRYPKVHDHLVEADGSSWTVAHVKISIFGNLYSCICTANF